MVYIYRLPDALKRSNRMSLVHLHIYAEELGTVQIDTGLLRQSRVPDEALLSDFFEAIRAFVRPACDDSVAIQISGEVLQGLWNSAARALARQEHVNFRVGNHVIVDIVPDKISRSHIIDVKFPSAGSESNTVLCDSKLVDWLSKSSYEFAMAIARALERDVLPPALDSYVHMIMAMSMPSPILDDVKLD